VLRQVSIFEVILDVFWEGIGSFFPEFSISVAVCWEFSVTFSIDQLDDEIYMIIGVNCTLQDEASVLYMEVNFDERIGFLPHVDKSPLEASGIKVIDDHICIIVFKLDPPKVRSLYQKNLRNFVNRKYMKLKSRQSISIGNKVKI